MKKDNRKQKQQEEEYQKPRFEHVSFWTIPQTKNLQSSLDIEWPEFKTEKERIRAYSKRYANVSISEAMCGIKEETINIPQLPVTPVVNGIYKARITKHGNYVSVHGLSAKEQVICRNNLKRYTNMEMTDREIDVKVVAIDKLRQTITIDVLQPLFENWINSIMEDKTIQYNVKAPKVVSVSNLRLGNGGFIGKAEIQAISEFIGEPYYVDAFIPGSQIVLNIENDFNRWNGATVDTFVAGYTTRPDSVNQMSLICSRKALLNFSGNLTKIELYGDYCSQGKKWKAFTKSSFVGTVTGVINSSKKCGVFVELPLFNITGMINMEPERLVEFKAGDEVSVRITDFEQMLEYDPSTGNMVHQEPYKIENNCLKSCILKPVLELA
jgi:hypothetical protein